MSSAEAVPCADPEGSSLHNLFLVYEVRNNPNTTISGPSSARQRNAFKWWPKIKCWLGSFVMIQGIRTSIFVIRINRRMTENGFAPPREFCGHILSCRELKAKSFKRCLHSVLRGVSL